MNRSLVAVLALAACTPKSAPVANPFYLDDDGVPHITANPEDPLPVDPSVEWGQLDNGLTWFVEENARPAQRADLRLIIRAGSILEDDDQRGLAHFVEHMAFNGSEHFPGGQLVDYLQSIGMRFGAHVNAYTSFDETAYMLHLPTDDPELLAKGLQVLRDQAAGLTFDPEECERERGVVLEEWRLGQGLQQRVQDGLMPLTFHGSRYLERMPIGTEESLKTFDCDAAKRFWEEWYRPELMAVMAVGDFDADSVKAQIAELFGPLTNGDNPRERVYYRVPDHEEVLAGMITDAELPQGGITLMAKVDDVQELSHDAYRRFLLESMVYTMVNERLDVLSQNPDAPFFGAGVGPSSIGHERGARVISVAPREGRELEAIRVALTEVERARRWGFTEGELDRARKESMRGMQAYWDERETTDSSTHMEELSRVYLTNEPMPGIPYEYGLSLVYLPEMDQDQASIWARKNLFPEMSRVAIGLMPEDSPGASVTADQLRAVMAEVAEAPIDPPEAEGELAPLTTLAPEPGTVEEVGRDSLLGTVTWKLGNGATVILKQTDFVTDQILMRAYSPGGLSQVEDEDYAAGALAVPVVRRSGIGEHNAISLSRVLAGHGTRVGPYVTDSIEGMAGGGSAYEIETTMQLVHLWLTEPRFDESAFRLERETRVDAVEAREGDPDAVFARKAADLIWQAHPRMTPWTVDELASVELDTVKDIYTDRFGDISDFTFVFVGNIDLDRMKTEVGTWLASIPGEGRVEEPIDRGIRRRTGVHELVVDRGDTPRTSVTFMFHGDYDDSWQARAMLSGLEDAVGDVMLEELRERLGGTYGVNVGSETRDGPTTSYAFNVSFECDPAREKEMTDAMWAVIDDVTSKPMSAERIASVREQRRREHESAVATNDFWVDALASALQRGEEPRELLGFNARNDAITPAALLTLAKRVFNRDQYIRLVQAPSEE